MCIYRRIGESDSREAGTEGRSGVVPVHEGDDSRLVVDIVEVRVRVIGVVDNKGAAEAVAVLRRQVAVVPERTRLVGGGKVIQERVAGGDRALVDEGGTVGPVGALLEEAVPVLQVWR